ncbi:hypothetical protein FKW77_010402 [Venturia effusa]|uniref:Epoxide hydrolase N-terminal domain-containing protein n=1 Tax=Venturia effusa TaxID=50376 RepID=A0A517L0G7_9PEZI|nr:hypothetical protein FKW77_010402 [Venturia effusa]
MMASPTPFRINVSNDDLELLRKKLELARLPDQPDGYDLNQGVPVPRMTELVEYWKLTYLPKWRQTEEKLNQLPMFTQSINMGEFGDLNVHFIHQRSEAQDAIPLLFVHGWPGSFLEAIKLLPLLTEEGDHQSFHVVCPSLPNYGFSQGVTKRGFSLKHYGDVCNKLMLSLGYSRYVAQGGDWGSMITRMMGRYHTDSLRAVHVNLAAIIPSTLLTAPLVLLKSILSFPFWTAAEKQGLKNGREYATSGNGYYIMQNTRPQTVAYCLSDSPIALLGWIYEKLEHWTDDYPWTNDEILTWISIYWFSTAGPGASVRTYFEASDSSPDYGDGAARDTAYFGFTKVPLGITQFPKDIVGIPRVFTQMLGKVVFQNWAEDGGHFAAWERPQVLADALRKMFKDGGEAFGIVAEGEGKKEM